MNIVVLAPRFFVDHKGGASRLAFDAAIHWKKQGHDVWLLTQDASGTRPEYHSHDGMHVLMYRNPAYHGLSAVRRLLAHRKLTQKLLIQYGPDNVDLVHGHSLPQYDGALALYRKRARLCFTVHSPVRLETLAGSAEKSLTQRLSLGIKARALHFIERRCLEQSHCVTSDSEFTRSMLAETHSRDLEEKIQVVPGWIDVDKFQIVSDRTEWKRRLGWPTDIPVLFTLRRLAPRMGLDNLLRAAKNLVDNGYRFFLEIGGKGPLEHHLKELSVSLGLDRNVHFAGFVPDEKLPLMYGATDVFVMPTAELECFGLPVLEALSCGRPVLATPIAAIPEVVRQVEPAWLARDNSVAAITHLIGSFLDGMLPERSPVELRDFVLRNYACSEVLPRMTSIIMKTVEKH